MMPPMLGQIALFPYDFAPHEWVFCDGRQLFIAENDALFFLLGNTFGGDGENTFAVPNLKAPKECHYCISLTGDSGGRYDERVVGDTWIWAASTNPSNLLECTGQALPASNYRLLFQYMGTRFGGDANNFNLPNLRNNAPDKCRYLMSVQGPTPDAPRDDKVFYAELILLPYDVPSNERITLCHGQLLSKPQNQALFALLGYRFGGSGDQFAFPDLRAATPPKFNYYMSLRGTFPPRG